MVQGGFSSNAAVAANIISGSWLGAAVAVNDIRWVIISPSSCCGLYEVGHGQL